MEEKKNIVEFRGPRKKTKGWSKEKKFYEFSKTRMPKLLKAMNSVKNLANKNYYSYTEIQKKKIISDFQEAYKKMNEAWKNAGKISKQKDKSNYWEDDFNTK
jgi:hypothetical protein